MPALAQDGVRTNDQLMSAADLGTQLNGQVIEFFDGSKSRYATSGRYIYTYTDDGPEWAGRFQLFDNSEVCVDFDNGSRRCDRFVLSGEKLVLITEDGTRFPVRNRIVYQE